MTDVLLLEKPSSDIVVLRLNRPQVRNALNLEVRTKLADEITRLGADPAVRCVIITGNEQDATRSSWSSRAAARSWCRAARLRNSPTRRLRR